MGTQRRPLFGQRGEAPFDVVVGHLDRRTRDGDPHILAQLDRRTDLDGRLEAERAPLALLDHLDFGAIYGIEVVLADRFGVHLGDHVLDGLARDGFAAVGLLENLARDFPRTEPGQPDAVGEFAVGPFLGRRELVCADGELQLHLRGREPGQSRAGHM